MAPNQISQQQLPASRPEHLTLGVPATNALPPSIEFFKRRRQSSSDGTSSSDNDDDVEAANLDITAAEETGLLSNVTKKSKCLRSRNPSLDSSASTFSTCRLKDWSQLFVYALAELIGGFTFSLLSPFYTREATEKGLTVSETGLVYGSVFITTIIMSPIFGKYINSIGSSNLFLYGTFLSGTTNILFGFLQYVGGRNTFFILSLAVRIVSAIGEAAFFCAIYPLAAQAAPKRYRSTVLSVMETMFGLGLMIGPFLGSVLYEVGGFYLPFVVCGVALAVCPVIAMFCIGGTNGTEPADLSEKTTYIKLLRMPCVFFSCLVLCLAQSSVAWYLPSLQPFLQDTFHLTTVATGAMFTVEGATYAAFSPLWGWLLDKCISPWVALYTGTICVIIGYALIGPSPYLPFIPENIYVVGVALSIMGFGVAATFITTLTFMLSESVKNGAPDKEQTRGMITSLWFISENLGGYIGATFGGIAFDKIGFIHGTTVVIGMQVIALVAILLMWYLKRRSKNASGREPLATLSTAALTTTTTRKKPRRSGNVVDEKSKLLASSPSNNNNNCYSSISEIHA